MQIGFKKPKIFVSSNLCSIALKSTAEYGRDRSVARGNLIVRLFSAFGTFSRSTARTGSVTLVRGGLPFGILILSSLHGEGSDNVEMYGARES